MQFGINESLLISSVAKACEKKICEDSFYEFVKNAFKYSARGVDYIDGWHVKNICDALQAVTDGKINRLLINIPIRCMKSEIVGVLWPAWEWTKNQAVQYIYVSHTSKLSAKSAVKMRNVIMSDWYMSHWPIHLEKDSESEIVNVSGGHRLSFGINSGVRGNNADRLIGDDPHCSKVYFDKERERTKRAWFDQCTTRLNTAESAIVLVMQRLHHDDLAASYEKDDQFEYICYPMEYELDERGRTKIGLEDPRTEEHEPLWKERFDSEFIDSTYKTGHYSPYFIASQLQQRPAPIEGGLIKIAWFKYYSVLPAVDEYMWSWDTAIKTGQENDYSVGLLWAKCSDGYYLIKHIREKLESADLQQHISNLYHSHPSSRVIIEDKASGQNICQHFARNDNVPVEPYQPGTTDKAMRLNLVAGLFKAGKVFLPMPEFEPWVNDYIEELVTFPSAKHDDRVDATTQYLLRDIYNPKSDMSIMYF